MVCAFATPVWALATPIHCPGTHACVGFGTITGQWVGPRDVPKCQFAEVVVAAGLNLLGSGPLRFFSLFSFHLWLGVGVRQQSEPGAP